MNIISTEISEVLMIEPQVFEDERGFFYESYNERAFTEKAGIAIHFVQDNYSCSVKNVLRGLHYQIQKPQGKLMRAVVGTVFDVAVDLRKSSPTLGQWVSCLLSAENRRQVWIPPGFAHGFLALSEVVEVFYKTTDYYFPQYERTLLWNDSDLEITWPLTTAPILSLKDQAGQPFNLAEVFD